MPIIIQNGIFNVSYFLNLFCFCFLVTPINQLLIILGRCTLYTAVCLQDEPTCMRIEPVYGSLTCTGDDCPCTGGLQLTSRSKGLRTLSCHSCKSSKFGQTNFPRRWRGSNPGPLAQEASARTTRLPRSLNCL